MNNRMKAGLLAGALAVTAASVTGAAYDYYDSDKDPYNYLELIDEYARCCQQKWDELTILDHGFSNILAEDQDPARNGFYLEDINKDSVPELLIGRTCDIMSGMFLDMYTLEEGEPVLGACSSVYDYYFLAPDGVVREELVDGISTFATAYFDLDEIYLEMRESLLYDPEYDSEDPWFYSTEDIWDYSYHISADEAQAVKESYGEREIPYTTFRDYLLGDYELTAAGSNTVLPDPDEEMPVITAENLIDVRASSELYEPELNLLNSGVSAFDNDLATGWTEGVEGQGIGETLTFRFDRVYELNGLMLWAGFHKSEDLYYKNSRPKRITVRFSDGSKEVLHLDDVFGEQAVFFDEQKYTDSLTIRIDSVYEGWLYEDTVISEIDFI